MEFLSDNYQNYNSYQSIKFTKKRCYVTVPKFMSKQHFFNLTQILSMAQNPLKIQFLVQRYHCELVYNVYARLTMFMHVSFFNVSHALLLPPIIFETNFSHLENLQQVTIIVSFKNKIAKFNP